jgi:hypothetical protein
VGNVDADAPPASERPSPAAPSAGTAAALVKRFRFEACFTRGIVASSILGQKFFGLHQQILRLAHVPGKLDHFPKSLSQIQFLFILINGAPCKKRHNRDCACGARACCDALQCLVGEAIGDFG